MRLLGKTWRFLVLLLLCPVLCAFGVEALGELRRGWELEVLLPMVFGGVVYAFVWLGVQSSRGILWDNAEFVRILRHEITHTVAALLVGSRVDEMLVKNPVKRSGWVGHVKHSRTAFSGPLIALAPYCVPVFTIPLLLLRDVTADTSWRLVDFLIGFTLAFHYIAILRDLGTPQDDIQRTGCLYAFGMITALNLLFLVCLKAAVSDDGSIILTCFRKAGPHILPNYATARRIAGQVLDVLRELLAAVAGLIF
jgi:hypothetical protein